VLIQPASPSILAARDFPNGLHTWLQVALLFITPDSLYHEPSWKAWLSAAGNRVPSAAAHSSAECSALRAGDGTSMDKATLDHVSRACVGPSVGNVIDQQHLFSIYVHTHPNFSA
jgi:hypothetical protein